MGKASRSVVTWEEVGTNRQQNCVRVRIGLHVGLVGEPVVNTEGDLKGFRTIIFVLGERTCLRFLEQKREAVRG